MTLAAPPRLIRPEAANAPESGIVEVANHGWGKPGLIPMWAGEGDMSTPAFICEAATRALAAGETFYTRQRGIPELREAIARYNSRLHGIELSAARFTVTVGGMHALQMAVRIACGTGDEVVIPSPAWPNFAACIGIAGATPVFVEKRIEAGRWRLNPDEVAAACTERTRAIVINSPSNPTGWTATRDELQGVLNVARQRGLWIIADEIYGRFTFDGTDRAPSLHDIADADDRILYVQTFSKNWAMTGWRLGWLEAPEGLGGIIENLVQYSTSGVPTFLQKAGIAALEHGEPFVAHQIDRARRGRQIIVDGLGSSNRIRMAPPEGAFYAFFEVDGFTDSRAAAISLVDEANVGLAPGSAFGPGAERFLRLCFERRAEDLVEAVARIRSWVDTRAA